MGPPGVLHYPANARDTFSYDWKNLWDSWHNPLPSQPVQCTEAALWYFSGGFERCSKCPSGFNLRMSSLLECFTSHPRGATGITWALRRALSSYLHPKAAVSGRDKHRNKETALHLPTALTCTLCLGSEVLLLPLKGYSSFMESEEVSYKAIRSSGL